MGKDAKKALRPKFDAELPEPEVSLSLLDIYTPATSTEKIFIVISMLFAVIHGVSLPILMILLGDLTENLAENDVFIQCRDESIKQGFNGTVTDIRNFCAAAAERNDRPFDFSESTIVDIMDVVDQNITLVYIMVAFGVLNFVSGFIHAYGMDNISKRIAERLRRAYFESIMSQDISFFEVTMTPGEINVHLSDDFERLQHGIGDKVSTCVQGVAQFLGGIVIGFAYSWHLALVISAMVPMMAYAAKVGLGKTAELLLKESESYAKAGDVATEVITAIITIASFGAQKMELVRYDEAIDKARAQRASSGFAAGLSFGAIFFVRGMMYAVAFGFGSWLFDEDKASIGEVQSALFSIMVGAFGLSILSMNLDAINNAKATSVHVFKQINTKSPIDGVTDTEGLIIDKKDIKGRLVFENVLFRYPSKPDQKILRGINLTIEPGQTVAFVGPSGCGKSSIIKLLERFYDPLGGQIYLDGHDITKINPKCLRKIIGLVGQEPVLFAQTIFENVSAGKQDGVATDQEVQQQLENANARDFIKTFKAEGMHTFVGEGGGGLSGGQKQRIAIARTLIGNPKILLLDEATSALDAKSEAIVQAALDNHLPKRTTLVIAHRLSTVRKADRIVGIVDGTVVEDGSHDELMATEGSIYRGLVEAQTTEEDRKAQAEEKKRMEEQRRKMGGMGGSAGGKKARGRGQSLARQFSTLGGMAAAGTDEEVKEDETIGEKPEDLPKVGYSDILQYNKPEAHIVALACLFSAIAGATDAVIALVVADMLKAWTGPRNEMWDEVWKNVGILCGNAVIILIAQTLKSHFAVQASANLVRRFRYMLFKNLLNQEIGMFEDPRFPPGVLVSRLASDCARIEGIAGMQLAHIFEAIGATLACLIVGFIAQWKCSLVAFAFFPFMVAGSMLQMKQASGLNTAKTSKKAKGVRDMSRAQIAFEATNNMNTITSLNRQDAIIDNFNTKSEEDFQTALSSSMFAGFACGMSFLALFMMFAATSRLGIQIIEDDDVSFDDFFKALLGCMFGGLAVGRTAGLIPDSGAAFLSAQKVFYMMNRKSLVDPSSDAGAKPAQYHGKIEIKDLHFAYPSRPDAKILKGVTLTINPGESVAFVGGSGCGKSTIIKILTRFYDPSEGSISLDGVDTRDINVAWYRKQIGFVQQEPTLMERSIADNIRSGKGDEMGELLARKHNCRDPMLHKDMPKYDKDLVVNDEMPMDEVIKCAHQANINEFVHKQQNQYDTNVGKGGGHLSGGQKQRVAIARTMFREPKILLLDEATSALDNESERLVNNAMDAAKKGKTVILIAHRLSTIRSADRIIAFDLGKVKETGTHEELVAKKGYYYNLIKAQL